MKKLLLSLGALSAVVAPVAAVVACGSTNDSSKKLETTQKQLTTNLALLTSLTNDQVAHATSEIANAKTVAEVTSAYNAATALNTTAFNASKKLASETKAKLESSLKNNGYTMDAAELTKLISALGKDARIISVSKGKEVKEDGTHGANDLLILVKSGKVRHVESEKFSDDFTGNEEKQVETLSVSGTHTATIGVHSDATHTQNIGSILKSSDSNWNIKPNDLKEATKVLYIQSGAATTVELADLMVDEAGDVFAINSASESQNLFSAEFSMKEFTATHA